jgi:hypothetical protein
MPKFTINDAVRRNPKRNRLAPERFATLTFVKGSGEPGCDHYDYDFDYKDLTGSEKDRWQCAADHQYSKDLEKYINVEISTQKLPEELGREIRKLVCRRSYYQNDIDFIAPDDIEPPKEITEDDDDEWVSGDETEEDESDMELEDD